MGCSASAPAAVGDDKPHSDHKAQAYDSFKRKQVAGQRREAFSSGKQAMGSAPAVADSKPAAPKTPEQIESLTSSCGNLVLFSSMSEEQQRSIFDAMFEVTCSTGDRVIQQGEIGDSLYIVDSGRFCAYLRAKGESEPVQTYTSGSLFGELALMYNCPRAATIRCVEAGRLWGLSRGVYEAIMRSTVNLAMDSRSQFLRSVEILSTMAEAERQSLADLLEERTYNDGEWLWKAGDPAECVAHRHYPPPLASCVASYVLQAPCASLAPPRCASHLHASDSPRTGPSPPAPTALSSSFEAARWRCASRRRNRSRRRAIPTPTTAATP